MRASFSPRPSHHPCSPCPRGRLGRKKDGRGAAATKIESARRASSPASGDWPEGEAPICHCEKLSKAEPATPETAGYQPRYIRKRDLTVIQYMVSSLHSTLMGRDVRAFEPQRLHKFPPRSWLFVFAGNTLSTATLVKIHHPRYGSAATAAKTNHPESLWFVLY